MLGADSRTSSGSYVANRVQDKITPLAGAPTVVPTSRLYSSCLRVSTQSLPFPPTNPHHHNLVMLMCRAVSFVVCQQQTKCTCADQVQPATHRPSLATCSTT